MFFLKKIEEKTKLRRFLLLLFDTFFLCPFSIFVSCYLLSLSWEDYKNIFTFYILLAFILFPISGQYKGISRYIGSGVMYWISLRNLILGFTSILFSKLVSNDAPSLNFWIIQWLFITVILGSYRFLLRDIYLKTSRFSVKEAPKKVAIYGAGKAGRQLSLTLKYSLKYDVIFFVDDSPSLNGRYIHGKRIINYKFMNKEKEKIDQILLAIPSLNSIQLRKLINKLEKFNLPIFTIPSIEDLDKRNSKIDYLRPIQVEDILRRDSVKPNPYLLKSCIENKVVCITGGGGSIGSELCNQVILLNPKKLIIIEKSEYNLYQIEKKIGNLKNTEINLQFVLNDCYSSLFLKNLFKVNSVEIVFHAAAYKHVPIVEKNIIEGIKNNVFSTLALCKASYESSVNKFLLVSSDKAVRPSNIMGASKRLSELIVTAFADKEQNLERKDSSTCFSMVRFGNVLNSSGSVVPLFKEQISNGGPITITHPEVIRYFMTIKEASELMLQACSMSKGGELFLLDMGSPVKIKDLAKKMIKLSGLSIKNKDNRKGDIEIIYKGLRTGEKLYEELLIDAEAVKTEHPLIYQAKEKGIPYLELMEKLNYLQKSIDDFDEEKVISTLNEIVPEWKKS